MTSNYENLLVEQVGHVMKITINRPETRNALNQATLLEMKALLDEVAANRDIRVVVLTGAGKGFCAGADLGGGDSMESGVVLIEEFYKPMLMAIVEMPQMVIAAVNGGAAGGGSGLAMICDFTVMGKRSYILQAFSTIALIPDCGATWMLPRAMGYRRALQAAVEADRLDAETCLEFGLANKVVEDEELVDATMEWAAALAKRAPLAVGLTKKTMRSGMSMTLSDSISLEGEVQDTCLNSEDFKLALTAMFSQTEAEFVGH